MATLTLDLLGTLTASMAEYQTLDVASFGSNVRFTSSCPYPVVYGTVYNNPSPTIGNNGIPVSYLYYWQEPQTGTLDPGPGTMYPMRINSTTEGAGSNTTGTWWMYDNSYPSFSAYPFYTLAATSFSYTGPTIELVSISTGPHLGTGHGTTTIEPLWNSIPQKNINYSGFTNYPRVPPVWVYVYAARDGNGDLGTVGVWGSNTVGYSNYNYYVAYCSQDGTTQFVDFVHPLIQGALQENTSQIGEVYTANWYDTQDATQLTNILMTPLRAIGAAASTTTLLVIEYILGPTLLDVISTNQYVFDNPAINLQLGDQNAGFSCKPIPAGFLITFYTVALGRIVIFIPSNLSGYYIISLTALDSYSSTAFTSNYMTVAADTQGNLLAGYSGQAAIGAIGTALVQPSPISQLIPAGPTPPPPTPGTGGGGFGPWSPAAMGTNPPMVSYTWHISLTCLDQPCGPTGYQRSIGT